MKHSDDTIHFVPCVSVENLPGLKASAVFTTRRSASVFREQGDIAAMPLSDSLRYMPWGANNDMPHDILDLIKEDETLSTCQAFNAEVCYGAGLRYETSKASSPLAGEAEQVCVHAEAAAFEPVGGKGL